MTTLLNAQGVQPLGSGTETDPYQVSSLDNLLWMSSNTVTGMFFEQTSDIDASATQNWNIGDHDNDLYTPDSAMGFQPIGDFYNSIAQYDGNGYTISDLYINRPNEDYVGLFSYLHRSKVVNLNLSDATVKGLSKTGALCGEIYVCTIRNFHTTGVVIGSSKVGGITGCCRDSFIENCSSSCYVSIQNRTSSYAGGIAGSVVSSIKAYSMINYCSNTGTITGRYAVGGIAGGTEKALLLNCSNTGNIFGYTWTGGITGSSKTSNIVGCYSDGIVSGISCVGGVLGYFEDSQASNNYATSSVSGGYPAGGFTGFVKDSVINNSYSTGLVSGDQNVGGFCGDNENNSGIISNCFWNINTSGQTASAGGTGKTTNEMKTVDTYTNLNTAGLDASWDFVGYNGNDSGSNDYWALDSGINNGYPYFINPVNCLGNPPVGSGTENDPFLISELENLYWLSFNTDIWTNGYYFSQTSDIDAAGTRYWFTGRGFNPIGNTDEEFTGFYNGNGYSISNLYIRHTNSSYSQGMFGVIRDSEIYNLRLENIYYELSSYQSGGGLFGISYYSEITDCSVSGIIGGISGGFADVIFSSEVTNCSFEGTIFGDGCGFARDMSDSNIMNCRSNVCLRDGGVGFAHNIHNSNVINSYVYGVIGSGINPEEHATGFCWETHGGNISDCYSFMKLHSYNATGFVVLCFESSIENSCFMGTIEGGHLYGDLAGFGRLIFEGSTITNSFWYSHGYTIKSAGGTRVSLAEMKDIATFTDLNTTGLDTPWDFLGTPFDDTGSDDIWAIDPEINDGFPYLYNNYQYFDITDNDDNTVPELPEVSGLNGNYPNPFNPETTISYSLAETGRVNIVVYNIKGQKVTTLVNEQQEKGNHSIKWSGRDSNSKNVSSGVYFVRMKAGKDVSTHKMLLLK